MSDNGGYVNYLGGGGVAQGGGSELVFDGGVAFRPQKSYHEAVFRSKRDSRVAGRAWMSLPGEPRVAGCVRQTAQAMAQGVQRLLQTQLAAAVTGIAGPGGGTELKPVGLVFVAVATPTETSVARLVFAGSRAAVRAQAAEAALRMLLVQACRD